MTFFYYLLCLYYYVTHYFFSFWYYCFCFYPCIYQYFLFPRQCSFSPDFFILISMNCIGLWNIKWGTFPFPGSVPHFFHSASVFSSFPGHALHSNLLFNLLISKDNMYIARFISFRRSSSSFFSLLIFTRVSTYSASKQIQNT